MPRPSVTPKTPKRRAATTANNPNHHLWLHGKNWWVYCAVNPTSCTKDKLRRSLATESIDVARFRRDELFRRLQEEGMLGRMRAVARPREAHRPAVGLTPGVTWQQRADAALAVVMSLPLPRVAISARANRAGRAKLQLCCT